MDGEDWVSCLKLFRPLVEFDIDVMLHSDVDVSAFEVRLCILLCLEPPAKLRIRDVGRRDRWMVRDLLAEAEHIAINDLVSFTQHRVKRFVVVLLAVGLLRSPQDGDHATTFRGRHAGVRSRVQYTTLLSRAGALLRQ
jgi:hypothetical protein